MQPPRIEITYSNFNTIDSEHAALLLSVKNGALLEALRVVVTGGSVVSSLLLLLLPDPLQGHDYDIRTHYPVLNDVDWIGAHHSPVVHPDFGIVGDGGHEADVVDANAAATARGRTGVDDGLLDARDPGQVVRPLLLSGHLVQLASGIEAVGEMFSPINFKWKV